MAESVSYQAFLRRFLTVLAITLLLAGLWFFRNTLMLTFLAIILAVGVSIPAHTMQRWGLTRGWANTLSALVIGLAAFALALWLVPAIVAGLGDLFTSLPQGLRNVAAGYNELRASSDVLGRLLPPLAPRGPGVSQQDVQALLERALRAGLPLLASGGSAALSLLTNLILVVAIALLALADPTAYVKASLYLIPKPHHTRVVALWEELYHTLRTWISTIFISIAITATLVWVVLGLLGMPNVAVVAAFAGFATFVPNIGAFLPLVPIAVFTLATNPASFFIMAPAYLAIQLLESNVFTPLIVKRQLSIPAAGMLVFQLAAGLVFGLLGVLLAVPLLAVIITLVRELYSYDVLGLRGDKLEVELDDRSRLQLSEGEARAVGKPANTATGSGR